MSSAVVLEHVHSPHTRKHAEGFEAGYVRGRSAESLRFDLNCFSLRAFLSVPVRAEAKLSNQSSGGAQKQPRRNTYRRSLQKEPFRPASRMRKGLWKLEQSPNKLNDYKQKARMKAEASNKLSRSHDKGRLVSICVDQGYQGLRPFYGRYLSVWCSEWLH